MKKQILKITKILFVIYMAMAGIGCASLGNANFKAVEIPFDGTMDTRCGYESFTWGMSIEECSEMQKQGYPFVYSKQMRNGVYEYKGAYGTSTENHYSHGNVMTTDFSFFNKRLYKVQDVLKGTTPPSFEELHVRYGDFSEKNIVSQFKNVGDTKAIYRNSEPYSLQIQIDKKGYVYVFMSDPILKKTIHDFEISEYLKNSKTGLVPNKWYVLGYVDGKSKIYNYIILNKNENDDKIVFYYKKDPENPVLSTLKGGFQLQKGYSYGKYEIKTNAGLIEKKFSSQTYKFDNLDLRYNITQNDSESARWFFNLIRYNENLTIRKDDRIIQFSLAGFDAALSDWGITLEELDYAIANEEF